MAHEIEAAVNALQFAKATLPCLTEPCEWCEAKGYVHTPVGGFRECPRCRGARALPSGVGWRVLDALGMTEIVAGGVE